MVARQDVVQLVVFIHENISFVLQLPIEDTRIFCVGAIDAAHRFIQTHTQRERQIITQTWDLLVEKSAEILLEPITSDVENTLARISCIWPHFISLANFMFRSEASKLFELFLNIHKLVPNSLECLTLLTYLGRRGNIPVPSTLVSYDQLFDSSLLIKILDGTFDFTLRGLYERYTKDLQPQFVAQLTQQFDHCSLRKRVSIVKFIYRQNIEVELFTAISMLNQLSDQSRSLYRNSWIIPWKYLLRIVEHLAAETGDITQLLVPFFALFTEPNISTEIITHKASILEGLG